MQTICSLIAVTAVSSALLVGCQKTDYPGPQPATGTFLTTAKVLFVNASNATGLTALIENTSAATALTPGQSTSYVAAPVSSDQIRIQGAGGTFGTNDLASKTTFLANTSYTVFVTDSITRPGTKNALTGQTADAGGIRLLTITDTLTAPATGSAKLRFFNLSPDVTGVASSTMAGPVSVRLLNSSGASALTLNNRAYRVATGANLRYSTVPAGTYVTQVYSATAVPSSLTATPVASSTVTLADSKIYTLYSRGLRRNNTLSVGTVQHN